MMYANNPGLKLGVESPSTKEHAILDMAARHGAFRSTSQRKRHGRDRERHILYGIALECPSRLLYECRTFFLVTLSS